MRGTVGIRENGDLRVVEVDLPKFDPRTFSNQFVVFTNAPDGLSDELIYSPDDPRFAWVHTLYHSSRMLEYFDPVFEALGVRPIEGLKIEIEVQNIARGRTSGKFYSEDFLIKLWGSALFDETAIYHEVGHAIYERLALKTHSWSRTEQTDRYTMDAIERDALFEAAADVFTALYIGAPIIEPEQPEPRNLSKVVLRSQVRSIRDDFMNALDDPDFRKNWPKNVDFIENALAGGHPVHAILDCPEPHFLSMALSGPIWRTAERFGHKRLLRLFAWSQETLQKSLSDAANSLISTCDKQSEREVSEFLRDEFRKAEIIE